MVTAKFSRKLAMIGLLLVLLSSLFAVQATTLGEENQRVFDDAGLFTDAEIVMLEAEIATARSTMKMDFVVLTSEEAEYSASDTQAEKIGMAFADDFYDYNGFGVGADYSGIIYFIDMSNRMPIITTCGTMINIITDERLEAMLDHSWNHLSEGDFSGSVLSVLQDTLSYVKAGVPEGQYQYDTETQCTRSAFAIRFHLLAPLSNSRHPHAYLFVLPYNFMQHVFIRTVITVSWNLSARTEPPLHSLGTALMMLYPSTELGKPLA